MDIALRKRTLSPVRPVLEDSSKRSFMLFVVVSLQLGSIILSDLTHLQHTKKSSQLNNRLRLIGLVCVESLAHCRATRVKLCMTHG